MADKEILKYCIENKRLSWQKHALVRMMERDFYKEEVKKTLLEGEVIEHYLEDKPYPSFLMLRINEDNIPLHVVASIDKKKQWCNFITAYRPDKTHFEDDFKTRRK